MCYLHRSLKKRTELKCSLNLYNLFILTSSNVNFLSLSQISKPALQSEFQSYQSSLFSNIHMNQPSHITYKTYSLIKPKLFEENIWYAM